MERHVLGGVKYLHDLTVTHMDTDYMRKVPLFPPFPRSRHILTRHCPSSTMRPSSDPSSSPRAQPTTSGSGARPTSARSTTPTSIRPCARSWRCLSTLHFTSLSFPHLLGSLTSTKRSFSTKTGPASFGQRVKSSGTQSSARSGGSSRATDGNTTRVSSLGCGRLMARAAHSTRSFPILRYFTHVFIVAMPEHGRVRIWLSSKLLLFVDTSSPQHARDRHYKRIRGSLPSRRRFSTSR